MPVAFHEQGMSYHTRTRSIVGITLVFALIMSAPRAPGEVDVSLSLETAAGYDSARYQEPEDEGDALFSIVPSGELTWFATDTTEINAGMIWRRNEFTESRFARTDSFSGYLALYRTGSLLDGGLSLTRGGYRDDAMPAYDQQWFSVSPHLRATDAEARQYFLNASVTYRSYDSLETAKGDRQSGTHWDARPGLGWPLSLRSSVWVEGYIEGNGSNEESDEYTGYGAGIGSTCTPWPRVKAWLLAQLGSRDYANDSVRTTVNRENQPTFLEGYLSYRLHPGVELFTSGRWNAYDSPEDEREYGDWLLLAGIRLVHDFLLGR